MSKAKEFLKITEVFQPGNKLGGGRPSAIGTKNELIKRVKAAIATIESYMPPGKYKVSIDAHRGDVFIEILFQTPFDIYGEHKMFVSTFDNLMKRMFPRSRVMIDFDRVKNIYLRGITVSVDPVQVEDFQHSYVDEIRKRRVHQPGSRYIPPSRY